MVTFSLVAITFIFLPSFVGLSVPTCRSVTEKAEKEGGQAHPFIRRVRAAKAFDPLDSKLLTSKLPGSNL